MAIAIEGAADILIVCGCIVLIGELIAVGYTFSKLAGVLDVDILGVRPFHGLAVAIRNTIVRWCEAGVADLEHVMADLWHGLAWQMDLMSRALHALAVAAEHSLGLLRRAEIPGLIHAAVSPLRTLIDRVEARIGALAVALAADVRKLTAEIATAERTAERVAERYTDRAVAAAEAAILTRLRAVEATIAGELGRIPGEISAAERTVEAQLAGLQDLIRQYGLPAALAALALLEANVLTLEAETGLDQAACRGRVKDLCGISPSIWADLIAGLALLEFGLSLRELVPPARTAVRDLTGAVQALA